MAGSHLPKRTAKTVMASLPRRTYFPPEYIAPWIHSHTPQPTQQRQTHTTSTYMYTSINIVPQTKIAHILTPYTNIYLPHDHRKQIIHEAGPLAEGGYIRWPSNLGFGSDTITHTLSIHWLIVSTVPLQVNSYVNAHIFDYIAPASPPS